MQTPDVSWFKLKYHFLLADVNKKGISRAISENIYEYRNKMKFRELGVSHPGYTHNLGLTNSLSAYKDAHENQPSSFYSLKKAFRQLDLSPGDISLLDYGCGAGRVLSFGMLLKFKELYGVDLDEPAIAKARMNAEAMARMGFSSHTEISIADACGFSIPASVNVIYFFNPFGKKTMQKVAENINSHCDKRASPIYIIYANPTCEEIFGTNGRCTKIFESYFRTKKPDIFIYRMAAET